MSLSPDAGTAARLQVNEIFHSIQGESRHAGRPCVFVRLTACNLRCTWCDTAYAFEEGAWQSIESILERVAAFQTRFVLITGGEPLLQAGMHELASELLARGHEVAVETGGSLDIAPLDRRVAVILDVKCPGSGMEQHNRWANLERLKPTDEVKFVVADRADYLWALAAIRQHALDRRCGILLSPVHGGLEPRTLAAWMLEDRLGARLQLQIHKYIWSADARGV